MIEYPKIRVRMTVEGEALLEKWKAQDHNNIKYECSISHAYFDGKGLTLFVNPKVQIKDSYELTANQDCAECRGMGWVRHSYNEIELGFSPCRTCFPEKVPV